MTILRFRKNLRGYKNAKEYLYMKNLEKIFANCKDKQEIYEKILELGQSLPPLDKGFQTSGNLVSGCQSIMHLRSFIKDGKVYFEASCDALISAGLVHMMILAYNGMTPQQILTSPPTFLKDYGILGSLSMNRSNGLAQIYMRMQKDAMYFLKASN